ncbi:methionine aminopeptidase 1D, mitochondrial-like [Eurytemora carolleeae]|uniref:methionine aminopeptidase 1D, mitochondrial-like n=1 Tax=Eurytemora carolleeae TaxID=1294199 RepID=UPI000C77A48C|nr:methionine aminopeptidase 1D, mitochondrial-like [Eurytemora carolleeae]|eukprot:XP_023320759.1 methionine aminopeptidase 1D, mitochondrial-like [Eurytemora affinis]
MRRSGMGWINPDCWRGFWSYPKPPPVEFSRILPDNAPELPDLTLIPDHVQKPGYYYTGKPEVVPQVPVIWNLEQIDKIRSSCKIASGALNLGESLVAPGVTTEKIDSEIREFILSHGAYPSPFNFKGFPKSISCSVNNVAAHGIPDARELEPGDIINIDITVFKDGFHGDCSDTFPVGDIDPYAAKLIDISRECLDISILRCKDGELYRTIGETIDKCAKKNKFSTIQILLGHGIGTFFHGPPDIYHCLNSYPGKMAAGMVFTIEPCLSEGDRRIRFLRDGWTAVTVDNSRTAQAEHTILITQTGAEILTSRSGDMLTSRPGDVLCNIPGEELSSRFGEVLSNRPEEELSSRSGEVLSSFRDVFSNKPTDKVSSRLGEKES